jgi:hypothetical protein
MSQSSFLEYKDVTLDFYDDSFVVDTKGIRDITDDLSSGMKLTRIR